MARRFNGEDLVVASHNQGKIREIRALLGPYLQTVLGVEDFAIPEPEETGHSFVANALLKAEHAARISGKPSLADDSGLAVHALGGEPGIYSARWAERPDGRRDFGHAMQQLEQRLGGAPDRSAHFVCALALAWPDGHHELVEGTVNGTLVWPPRGDRGFGYDPMFRPDGHAVTFGEMDPDHKHTISHRADAFAKLVAACFSDGN